jgi:hypothetical protein
VSASAAAPQWQPQLPAGLGAWLAILVALASGAVGLELAWHHPLSGPVAVALWVVVAVLAAVYWVKTPVLILAPLPVLAFAPWSGWITFEEMDLLVSACACGGYLAWALQLGPRDRAPAWRHGLVYSPIAKLLLGVLALSLVWSIRRGVQDAGGLVFGWFQGYQEPMNALRNGKALLEALLLLPLWAQAAALRPRGFSRGVLLGLVAALTLTCVAAFWERLAYTGLLDFSTDYRSTAMFWEMHVGGAALDGFLLLTLPFAVLALLRTRSPWRFGVGLGVVLLAVYVCLTTFSRGVYLALPLALIPMLLLADAQRRRALAQDINATTGRVTEPLGRLAKVGALAMAGAFALSAALVFGGGGYRGLLALLGVMTILITMPNSLWLPSFSQRLTALLMGALLAAVVGAASWALSMAVPKAAYVLYGVALAACAYLRWRDVPGQPRPVYLMLVNGAWFWLLTSMVTVSDYWGGTQGRWTSLAALLGLGALWCLLLLEERLWPLRSTGREGWRKRALVVSGLVFVMAIVAALGGGAYLRDRVASWKEDGQTRITHWRDGLRLLNGSREWLLGKGTGRFAANHFYSGPIQSHVGDYRIRREGDTAGAEDGEAYLALASGHHMLGRGEMFRLSQRISAAAANRGPLKVVIKLRSQQNASMFFEVCDRHLLYVDNCASGYVDHKITAAPDAPEGTTVQPGEWRTHTIELGHPEHLGGVWWAPRLVSFAMAVSSTGSRLDVARVELHDAQGHQLLENGDFNREMARWFFSSDRHHLPWHMKNLELHVLFEQGLIGLALMSAAFLLAVGRLSFGRGRDHPLAPAFVAALIGFVAVGAFDSLLDVPRAAFVFFTLLVLGLGLRALPGEGVHRVA